MPEPREETIAEIQRRILGHQRNNDGTAGDRNNAIPATNAVVTTRDGTMKPKEDVDSGEEGTTSDIPQDTLANSARMSSDQEIVKKKLPTNAKFVSLPNGAKGWKYWVTTSWDIDFQFFIYFDGAYYQAFCIKPEIDESMRRGEGEFRGEHDAHLYMDGRVCMGKFYNSGWKDLEGAFGKTVLWADGVSMMLLSGKPFPYNYNQ